MNLFTESPMPKYTKSHKEVNMKGSVGTATHITYVPKTKQKYKNKRKSPFFCISCRGWIKTGQWFSYTKRGTTKHFYKTECRK